MIGCATCARKSGNGRRHGTVVCQSWRTLGDETFISCGILARTFTPKVNGVYVHHDAPTQRNDSPRTDCNCGWTPMIEFPALTPLPPFDPPTVKLSVANKLNKNPHRRETSNFSSVQPPSVVGNSSWIGSKIHHNTELWTQLTENRWIRVEYSSQDSLNERHSAIPRTNYLHVYVQ